MKKKVALVLGGNGGIGSSAVKRLVQDGFHVCATFHKNRDQIDKIKASLNVDNLTEYKCNALNGVELNKTINAIISNFGEIDVVVISLTSALPHKRLLDLEWIDYKERLDIQLKPMHYIIKALDKQLRTKHKTKIIIILTEYCIGTPPKGLSYYVTSKYAAMGMAKSMAIELSQYDSTVNMISPGMVETPLLDDLPSKLVEMTAYQNPMKRNAVPKDVSNAISFLASDQSDYLNGTNITLNGGGKML